MWQIRWKVTGHVDARDLTDYKVELIRENIRRTDVINVEASRKDATILDKDSIEKADVVLADVPCSGLGVIGKKTDIKYRIEQDKIRELVVLQRQILHNAAAYVKPGGTLIYSTCTITREENQENVQWFVENYPYELESLDLTGSVRNFKMKIRRKDICSFFRAFTKQMDFLSPD